MHTHPTLAAAELLMDCEIFHNDSVFKVDSNAPLRRSADRLNREEDRKSEITAC